MSFAIAERRWNRARDFEIHLTVRPETLGDPRGMTELVMTFDHLEGWEAPQHPT